MPTFRTSQPAPEADPTRPHLILVGLPGSGKSTVGQGVARALGRPFLDLDVEIERREGRPISRIFAEEGESYFRRLERRVTEELALFGNMVVAPGGGWVAQPEVVGLVRPPGKLVYLRVTPTTALARLGANRGTRPLLNHPNPTGELERLLAARRSAYEGADWQVDTELLDTQEVTERVVALATTGVDGVR